MIEDLLDNDVIEYKNGFKYLIAKIAQLEGSLVQDVVERRKWCDLQLKKIDDKINHINSVMKEIERIVAVNKELIATNSDKNSEFNKFVSHIYDYFKQPKLEPCTYIANGESCECDADSNCDCLSCAFLRDESKYK